MAVGSLLMTNMSRWLSEMLRQEHRQFVRFLIVASLGLLVDVGIALGLTAWLGAPLLIASGTGFLVAACFNYVLLELWSFRREASALSFRRLTMYLLSVGFALIVRLALVSISDFFLESDLQSIIIGATASIIVNYFFSSRLIFLK